MRAPSLAFSSRVRVRGRVSIGTEHRCYHRERRQQGTERQLTYTVSTLDLFFRVVGVSAQSLWVCCPS